MNKRILVIEDEPQIARVLKIELEFEEYDVLVEHNGRTGLHAAMENKMDLILLDVMLPELNGIEVLRRLRKANNLTPVILLTARNMTLDKVIGLDQGANDYITKPYEIEELLARVRACIRDNSIRDVVEKNPILSVEDLKINTNTREVTRSGKAIAVTPKEYDLLLYLIMNKNKVVTRENIIMNVWGYEYEGETNVIDVFIRHLRKKVEEEFGSELIHTIRGVGFTIREK